MKLEKQELPKGLFIMQADELQKKHNIAIDTEFAICLIDNEKFLALIGSEDLEVLYRLLRKI